MRPDDPAADYLRLDRLRASTPDDELDVAIPQEDGVARSSGTAERGDVHERSILVSRNRNLVEGPTLSPGQTQRPTGNLSDSELWTLYIDHERDLPSGASTRLVKAAERRAMLLVRPVGDVDTETVGPRLEKLEETVRAIRRGADGS